MDAEKPQLPNIAGEPAGVDTGVEALLDNGDALYVPLGSTALTELPATLATTGSDGSFTDSIENLRR